MDILNPFNLCIWIVVVLFWSAAIVLSRAKLKSVSPTLLILPFFFIVLGTIINRYHLPWGTYAIAVIHVMMLPALLRIANSKL